MTRFFHPATIAALVFGAIMVATLGHVLLRVPIAFGDQFQEIVIVHIRPMTTTLARYLDGSSDFFRPMEYVWRYLIADGFGQGVWGYNLFQVTLLSFTMIGFVALCRPQSLDALAAFLIAICVLFGHHAMHGTWELNIVFSNGLVLFLMIVVLVVIAGRGSALSQTLAIVACILAMLTKEVGLVAPGVFVLAHLLRMDGSRRWAAALVTALVIAYLAFRFGSMESLGVKEGKAHDLPGYLSNIAATFVMFWVGLPQDGDWNQATRFASHPWRWVQIAAGLSAPALLLIGWRFAPSAKELEADAPALDRRWLLLFGAALGASCMLGFYYTRHRHGAPALPLLAYCVFLSLRVVFWRLERFAPDRSRLMAFVAVVALGCAVLWPLRVVTGFEFVRGLSGGIRANWWEDMPAYMARSEPYERLHLDSFARSVDTIPWPVANVPILQFLGTKHSVNR